MTKIAISEDERWPTYSLVEVAKHRPAVEVDDETLARWQAAMEAFDAVQDEMGAMHKAAEEKARADAEIAKAEKALADAQARLEALRQEGRRP